MRGITPIVAMVILIGITVTLAVGLYFWVGQYTSQPGVPNKPPMIQVIPIGEKSLQNTNVKTTRLLVQDLDNPLAKLKCLQTTESGQGNAHTGIWCVFVNSSGAPITTNLKPGDQAICELLKLYYLPNEPEGYIPDEYSGEISLFTNKSNVVTLKFDSTPIARYIYNSTSHDPCA